MQNLCFDERIRAKIAHIVRGYEDMHVYQHEAWQFLRDNPFSHLFIDLGMGKTVSSLTLIAWLLREITSEKILVIGPVRVMSDTWPTEIGLWEHTAHMSYTLIREDDDDPRLKAARAVDRRENPERSFQRDMLVAQGVNEAEILTKLGPTNDTRARHAIRAELARSSTNIHFINKEQLEWLVNLHKGKWPYRTVIIDEVSLFKDHSTHVFKALAKVRRTPGLITRLHGLTATPAAETYEHLWTLLYLLDLGERLGKKISWYRERYFTYNKWSMKFKLRPDAEHEILAKISDVCLVMKAEDYLQLEKPNIIVKPVTLDPRQLDLYTKMEADFIVTLDDGTKVEADNAAALTGKLLQMASGVLYETVTEGDWEVEDTRKVTKVHHLHDHKIETLKEIVESLQGKPVLVAYHFKSSLDRLKKTFPKAVVMDRDGKCVKDWNAGKIQMLLIHPKSGGHGLNLQHGGHNLVFFDLTWSLELYLQLIGRLARQGQKHPVLVQLLVAIGTLDEAVCSAINGKAFDQEALFRILRRLVRAHRERQKGSADVGVWRSGVDKSTAC
jgi:SNF2 family DNA or RNA helicase